MIKKRYVIVVEKPDGREMEFEFDSDRHAVTIKDGKAIVTEGEKCVFYTREEHVLFIYEENYMYMPGIKIKSDRIELY